MPVLSGSSHCALPPRLPTEHWNELPTTFERGCGIAARIDGDERRVFAMVKVREQASPYSLMFAVKVPDVAGAAREITARDLQVRSAGLELVVGCEVVCCTWFSPAGVSRCVLGAMIVCRRCCLRPVVSTQSHVGDPLQRKSTPRRP